MAIARYQINGKFNNSAIKDAQVSLAKLQKSFSNAALGLKALVIGKVMQVGANAINGATDAFREQELQVERLKNAVKTNANLTSESFKRLQDEAGKLSDAAIFSGESITKNQAFLASMKLNEKEINKVMQAATNMASAGVMPLDQAVKTLSKTYGGNLGKLKELNPELGNLTEEQLRNGEAVTALVEQYQGFNEVVANSEHGKALQFANTFDDLRKTIGEIIQSIQNIGFAKMLEPLKNITSKLKENKDKIINFFRYLPEVVGVTLALIDGMMKKVFTFKFLIMSIKNVAKIAFNTVASLFSAILAAVVAVSSFIWAPLGYGFEMVIYGIQQAFYGVMNFFVNGLNVLIEKINWIREKFGQDKIASFEKWGLGETKKPENKIWGNIKASFDRLKDTVTSGVDVVSSAVKDAGQDYGALFKDEFSGFSKNFGKILSRENKKNKSTIKGDATSTTENSETGRDTGKESPWAGLMDSVKSAGGAVGWLGNVAEQVAKAGNPLIIVVELLKIVLDGMLSILAPVINSILAPLFGILRVLGKFLGLVLKPLLMVLEPILRPLIKAFLFLYNNVLVPIGNGLIFVFNLVYNAIAGFINGVSKLVRIITFGAVNLGTISYRSLDEGKLEKINETELSQEGYSAVGGGSGASNAVAGSSAAVAAKPTEVNIFFEHSFVNGDAREIALMLRKEIKEAEKLGY